MWSRSNQSNSVGRLCHPDAPAQKAAGVVNIIYPIHIFRYSYMGSTTINSLFVVLRLLRHGEENSDTFLVLQDT